MLRFGLALSALVIVVDQIAKAYVLGPLGFSPPGCRETFIGCGYVHLSPIFDLRMVWNTGVSFGMMKADSLIGSWALVALSFAICWIFMGWLRTAERRLSALALGLVIGGAIGNVIDRIRFGAVVDFLDFHGLFFPWVFNVADASISTGAVLLGLDLVLHSESWKAKPQPAAAGPADSPQNGHDPG